MQISLLAEIFKFTKTYEIGYNILEIQTKRIKLDLDSHIYLFRVGCKVTNNEADHQIYSMNINLKIYIY